MNRSCIWLVTLLMGMTLFGQARAADEPWWQALDDGQQKALGQILQGDLSGWDVLARAGRKPEALLGEALGQPCLTAGRVGTVICYKAKLQDAYVVTVRFRFAAEKRAMSVRVTPAIKDPANKDEVHPWASVGYRGGDTRDSMTYYFPVPDVRDRYLRVQYYEFNGNGARQLRWPEEFRKEIEFESSETPKVSDTWQTMKGIFHRGKGAWYLNGLLVSEYNAPDMDVSGNLEIEFMPGAEIGSVAVDPAPEADPTFMPVALDPMLNSKAAPVDAASLPPAGKQVEVDGVPFVFPTPNAANYDHVDVGESWFQEGSLEGHMSGRGAGVGGRWRGAFYRTPARLQVSVPTRPYRAIHLIAAYDEDANSVPVVTAQFYRPQTGFPSSFAIDVPGLTAKNATATALPVKLANGKSGNLYHVVIPIDPGELRSFLDQDAMEFELTKAVRLWRAYPDPSYYSIHAAGLPSGVHVYAMTLEQPLATLTITPGNYAHVFTAPEKVAYTLAVTNRGGNRRTVSLSLDTVSYDGSEKTSQKKQLALNAGATLDWQLALPLKRYGLHYATVTMTDGDQTWTETFNVANLHPDTRERGNWDWGKGPFFGYWAWRGGHFTPQADQEALVMGLAGADGRTGTYQDASEAEKEVARRFKMVTLKHFAGSDHWVTSALASNLTKMSKEEAVKIFVEGLEKIVTQPSDITQLKYVSFFAEPHLGLITSGIMPEYYGGEPAQPDEHAKERVEMFANAMRVGVPIVRDKWPGTQIMMPHGDPMFCTYMLRWAPDLRPLTDGIAVDIPCFERLPEMQLHQVAIHRLYQSLGELKKMGKTDLHLPMYEGPCLSDYVGALPKDLAADLVIRNCLMLLGYGVDQFTGAFGAFHAGGYWGEQHYGGGLMVRKPLEYPKAMYCTYATLTRQLNRRPFDGWIATGSTSAYCMRFKHYRDGSLVYVLWQIRGTRPAVLTVPAGTTVEVYDEMDNPTSLKEQNGQVTVTLSSSPIFVHGLKADPAIALGTPEHADAKPADGARILTSFGDGAWQQVEGTDEAYEENTPLHVKRTRGVFTISTVDAPKAQGGRAMAVRLGKQEVDRNTQPYYTILEHKGGVNIPGQASAIGVWVKASSDWGRIIYSLRDAKGERWVSIGQKEEWNCDDMHSWSSFNFDGWRYLRFEMPSTSPWDEFRNAGTTWWGSHGGDGIVDLPLRLETVIIERRQKVMYINDPQPASTDDVLLGTIYAEYDSPADATADAVRISKIRRPAPQGAPDLENPIAEMRDSGELPPVSITKIRLPEQVADGTRCYVDFPAVEGAESYTVWAAPYEDGRGALPVGKAWKDSGGLIRGLRADTDFWLFVVASKKDGRKILTSKPADGFKIHLKDIFSNK